MSVIDACCDEKKISNQPRHKIFSFFKRNKQQISQFCLYFLSWCQQKNFPSSLSHVFVLFHFIKWKYSSLVVRVQWRWSEMACWWQKTQNRSALCREKCQRQLFLISRDGLDSWQSNFLLPSTLITIMWLVFCLLARGLLWICMK